MLSSSARIHGCLLGGAVGDALGAPIEFHSLTEIRKKYGQDGLQEFAPAYGRVGALTDDTQMTLFTAEGLLRAWVRAEQRGLCSIPGVVHHAYLRWLLTQGERPAARFEIGTDGWLFGEKALHSRRAPGNTCLAALRSAIDVQSPLVAANDSKGCGAVMRSAPVGLFARMLDSDLKVFDLAIECARLTHGHSSGFLSAGCLAVIIAGAMRGRSLVEAVENAKRALTTYDGHEETLQALEQAIDLSARGRPTPEQLERLGGGWVGEEALAIAVCSALSARDFKDAVILAANHSGDSDSTAAIAGNIVGAFAGDIAIPTNWLEQLELRDAISALAADLESLLSGQMSSVAAWDRYPGW